MSSWWYPVDVPLVLASRSPRRKIILGLAGIPFLQVPSSVEEEDLSGEPLEVVEHWACMKARNISLSYPSNPVLGADTMVALDNRLLGKPVSRSEAAEMLGMLSGRWHTVFGGVSVIWAEKEINLSFTETTRVKFRQLEGEEITAYMDTGEPFDKAGAYGIQGYGSVLVEKVDGCYFNVMGLPVSGFVHRFRKALADSGIRMDKAE